MKQRKNNFVDPINPETININKKGDYDSKSEVSEQEKLAKYRQIEERCIETEEKTNSGFILPSASQEKQQMAKIVAVGPGGVIDGKEVVMQVKVGDTVTKDTIIGKSGKSNLNLDKENSDENNTILIVGYMAENTLGRRIKDGKKEVKNLDD